MFNALAKLFRNCRHEEAEAETMADEIGFHAIWNQEYHNCRPSTWAHGEGYAAGSSGRNHAELSYAGQVEP